MNKQDIKDFSFFIIFILVIAGIFIVPMFLIVELPKLDDVYAEEDAQITDVKISSGFLGGTKWYALFSNSTINNRTYNSIGTKYVVGTWLHLTWKKLDPESEWRLIEYRLLEK